MKISAALPLAALALLGTAPAARAQEKGLEISVVPSVGWYNPTSNLRRTGDAQSGEWTRMAAGPALGLNADVRLPIRALSVRAGVTYVDSDLSVRRLSGFEPCGTSCSKATYEVDPVAGSRILIVSGDVLLHGPRLGPVQPYLVGGIGARRYDFAQGDLTDGYAAQYGSDVTRRTTHVGVGTDLHIGKHTMVLELGNYSGDFNGSSPDGGMSQNDLSLTAGFRIGVR